MTFGFVGTNITSPSNKVVACDVWDCGSKFPATLPRFAGSMVSNNDE